MQVTAIILSWTLLLTIVFGSISRATLQGDRGQILENLAIQMAQTLDYKMYIHFQEVKALAEVAPFQSFGVNTQQKQKLLETLQQTNADYAWIGLTSPAGTIEASTEAILAGADVSERPWFIEGRQSMTVQDVHPAKLLANLVPNPDPDGEPLRFVDISAPVTADDGALVGVIGAHLYWQWAARLRDGLLAPMENYHQAEVILLSETGEVLLAPTLPRTVQGYQLGAEPEAAFRFNGLLSYQQAIQGHTGHRRESGPDGEGYLTGYAQTRGYQTYPGLGWVVLVRQPIAAALAPFRQLQQQFVLWGIAVGILSGFVAWWFAGRVTRPILLMARAADRMSRGDRTAAMPIFAGRGELAMLSQAIVALLTSLDSQNQRLEEFNNTLELSVQHRTKQLNRVNQRLQAEIKQRQQVQRDLEIINQELQEMSLIDELTQVANRRHFDQHLKQEWERAYREQKPISLLLIDVDFFKGFNDFYGHPAGDRCLQRLAQAFSFCAKRPTDLVARYGGEEFAMILPDTAYTGAVFCAQTIQDAVAALKIAHQSSTFGKMVTVSLGVATTVPQDIGQYADLIASADRCLYEAKTAGRNRSVGVDLRAVE